MDLKDILTKKSDDFLDKKLKIQALFAGMSSEDQMQVFKNVAKDERKVVLSTNIAETSLTIPNICYIVDCGYVKQKNLNVLAPVRISKAAAI